MENHSTEKKRKGDDHLEKRDSRRIKSHHQPQVSHQLEKRYTHIEAIGNDCIGQIFTFLTLNELGSVIARASKQWQHIVETSMPKCDEECSGDFEDEDFDFIITALDQLQSPIGRRHMGAAYFGSRIRWDFFHEDKMSILAPRLTSSLVVPSSLHTLGLNKAALSSDDFGKMFTALHRHSTLTRLDLSGNRFDDDDITQSLAELIRHNRAITTLRVDDCKISPSGMIHILSALQPTTTLETLDLSESALHSSSFDILAQVLSTNTSLTQLRLGDCSIRFDDLKVLCRLIASNQSLKSLDLNFNHFGDECGEPLSEMIRHNSALTHLDIGGDRIRTNGMQMILDAVSSNSTIKTLDIGRSHLDGECASALVNILTRNSTLTELILVETMEGMDWKSLFVGLRQNRSIMKVDLSCNKFTADDIRSLISLVTDSDHPSSIRSIDLSYSSLSDESISLIADVLKHRNCELASLMLSYNMMTLTGFEAMLSALHHNTSLTEVDLSSNRFKMNDHLVGQLLALAQSNTTLKFFNYQRSSLIPAMMKLISATDCQNRHLKNCYLRGYYPPKVS